MSSESTRVLLLEDAASDAELIEDALRGAGVLFTARRVESREDFIREIDAFDPDVILIDYQLPAFDGLKALQIAQQRLPHTPVIAVTGALGDELAAELLRQGARDYILKDRLSRLAPAVRRALDEARAADGARALAEALLLSERKYRRLFEASKDGILIVDAETGTVVDVNPYLIELLGYSRAEFLGKKVWELGFLKDIVANQESLAELQQQEYIRFEDKPLKTSDGRRIDVEFVSNVYQVNHQKVIQCNIRDITERKRSEDAMLRAISALKALSNCNKAFAHASDEGTLLNEICRIVVIAGYRLAWVGIAEHDAQKTVRPVAHAGYIEGFMERTEITWGDGGSGQGPASVAIRTGEPQLVQDAHTDPSYELWRDSAIKLGYRSVLCLPLLSAGTVLGVLSIYADNRNGFDAEEIRLLSGLANDIAFGIVTLRTRAAHEQSAQRLERSMESTVQTIAATIEIRDPYTAGHQNRVAELAAAIAREMDLPDDQIHGLHLASMVHDVGKIQIPAEILSKPTRLTEIEYEIIKTHAQAGYDVLKDVDFPWPIADIVWQHHERLDGSGYPRGLKTDDILIEAKILAVADTIEAMSAARPYRPAVGIDAALKEIARCRGTQYDASAVDACLRLFGEKRFAFNELRPGAMI